MNLFSHQCFAFCFSRLPTRYVLVLEILPAFQSFSFTEILSFVKPPSGKPYTKACLEWAETCACTCWGYWCSLRNLIPGRRLIVLTSVIDEGPYFCSVHKSTFCCCFSPTYCLCWSISSWRKPNVYISSLLKSLHSILKLGKEFWHSCSFITDTGKLWDIVRMSQERKMFIFDFSYLDPLRLFASYFQLRSTAL